MEHDKGLWARAVSAWWDSLSRRLWNTLIVKGGRAMAKIVPMAGAHVGVGVFSESVPGIL